MGKGWKAKRRAEYAAKLNANLPNSEKWFHSLYADFRIADDRNNESFAGYIPDLINKRLKYIIEVDGSIHQRSDIRERDELKDIKFKGFGYEVIRVKAYSFESFREAMIRLVRHRGRMLKAIEASKRPKTIIRKAI